MIKRIEKHLNKIIGTELHFDKGIRHITSIEVFKNGKNICTKFYTEDDYFCFTAENILDILLLLFTKGVRGHTRDDDCNDYIEILGVA